jgi:uncharacterized protein
MGRGINMKEINITQDEKTWAMMTHLLSLTGYISGIGFILGPLLMWLFKKDKSSYVNYHGKESLNFQISIIIYGFIAGILCFFFIGFLIFPVLGILQLILVIIASVKAKDGEEYRYPMTIRFIK